MTTIYRSSRVQVTPRTSVDVRWVASETGFTVTSIQALKYVQRTKGIHAYRGQYLFDNLNDAKMEVIHADIQRQINAYNQINGTELSDVPELVKIESRANFDVLSRWAGLGVY